MTARNNTQRQDRQFLPLKWFKMNRNERKFYFCCDSQCSFKVLLLKRSRQRWTRCVIMGCDAIRAIFGQLQRATFLAANIKWHLRFRSSLLTNRNAIKAMILLQLHTNVAHRRCSQKTPCFITTWIIVHFTLLTDFVQYLLQCNDKKLPSMGKKDN